MMQPDATIADAAMARAAIPASHSARRLDGHLQIFFSDRSGVRASRMQRKKPPHHSKICALLSAMQPCASPQRGTGVALRFISHEIVAPGADAIAPHARKGCPATTHFFAQHHCIAQASEVFADAALRRAAQSKIP